MRGLLYPKACGYASFKEEKTTNGSETQRIWVKAVMEWKNIPIADFSFEKKSTLYKFLNNLHLHLSEKWFFIISIEKW
jgi:hypothetical protein